MHGAASYALRELWKGLSIPCENTEHCELSPSFSACRETVPEGFKSAYMQKTNETLRRSHQKSRDACQMHHESVCSLRGVSCAVCGARRLGTNAMAALVTRGCTEMRRLVSVCGGPYPYPLARHLGLPAVEAVTLTRPPCSASGSGLVWDSMG